MPCRACFSTAPAGRAVGPSSTRRLLCEAEHPWCPEHPASMDSFVPRRCRSGQVLDVKYRAGCNCTTESRHRPVSEEAATAHAVGAAMLLPSRELQSSQRRACTPKVTHCTLQRRRCCELGDCCRSRGRTEKNHGFQTGFMKWFGFNKGNQACGLVWFGSIIRANGGGVVWVGH
jgi:hypothetical protein